MTTYICLSKCQIIEKLDLLQGRVDKFEHKKRTGKINPNAILAIAIVTIGRGFNIENNERQIQKARSHNVPKQMMLADDGSSFCNQYILTGVESSEADDLGYIELIKEPIAMTEYATRLASGRSTHVFQIDNVIEDEPSHWKQTFAELKLTERPGRARHTFMRDKNIVTKLFKHFQRAKSDCSQCSF